MPDSPPKRLGSVHLEDLAIVALTAAGGAVVVRHPELDDDRRARLRYRLKQFARHDWPASLKEDPLLRRGYTLRQCLRLVTALLLVDAHLAPSDAIALAKANEVSLLRVMAARLPTDGRPPSPPSPEDLIGVIELGELTGLVAAEAWRAAHPDTVRFVRRGDLGLLWSAKADLAHPGQRLVIDFGTAAAAVWQWFADLELMTGAAKDAFAAAMAETPVSDGYVRSMGPIRRQR